MQLPHFQSGRRRNSLNFGAILTNEKAGERSDKEIHQIRKNADGDRRQQRPEQTHPSNAPQLRLVMMNLHITN